MYLPVVLHLQTTAKNAIARLPPAAALPEMIENFIEAAHANVLDSDLTPLRALMADYGFGKPQFALAILVALVRELPECYHRRTFLYGLLEVFMSETTFTTLAEHLQTKTHDDFSHGALLPIIFGVIVRMYLYDGKAKLQSLIDTVLAYVFEEIKGVAAFLAMRDAVLQEIRSRKPPSLPPPSPSRIGPRAAALKDTPRLLLENLRRSSQGFGRPELLKFKCTPTAPTRDGDAVGQKRAARDNDDSQKGNKRAKTCDKSLVPIISQQQQKAQDAYIQRKIKRERKEKQARDKDENEGPSRRARIPEMTSSTSTPSKTPRPYSRYHKVAKPQPKPSPVPLPKSRGAYPNPISKELQTEIDVLILAPDADFRLKDFTIKAPAMPNTVWTSIPVDEPKKCEGFLAIGQHIIESSLAYLVYEQRFVAPLSDELVLGCLKSENTLQSVLIQAGVFHEPETVPAHLPAKALKIYLGTLFLSETMTFEAIESWLHHIFRPVVLELRHKPGHVGNYEENRARLAAVHMRKRR